MSLDEILNIVTKDCDLYVDHEDFLRIVELAKDPLDNEQSDNNENLIAIRLTTDHGFVAVYDNSRCKDRPGKKE